MTPTRRQPDGCSPEGARGFGIAFEGCAGKAAFHIGVMERFAARAVMPAAVAGASSGAIIAALVALGHTASLREVWISACGQPVFQPKRLLGGRWPFAMSDIVGNSVRDHVGDLKLAEIGLPIAIAITQLHGGRLHRRALTNADPHGVWEAVLASCFLPGPYSRMVPIDGRLTLDGAWQSRAPFDLVPPPASAKVVACVTNPAGQLAGGFFRPRVLPVPHYCRILAPVAPLQVGAFDLSRSRQAAVIDIGRDSAERFIDENLPWLQPDAGATASAPHWAKPDISVC